MTTDDDVWMPVDWLDRLVAPFRRSDVMAVTGNVLPAELETKYSGCSRPTAVSGEASSAASATT